MPKVSVMNGTENPVLVNLADGNRHRLGVGQGANLDLTESEIKSLKKTPGYEIGEPSKAGAKVDESASEGDGGAKVEEPTKAKSAGRPKKEAAAAATPADGAPALPGTAPAALPLPGTN